MNRDELLKRIENDESICCTITNSCPFCNLGNIEFEDEDELIGAKCSNCGKKIDDNYVRFCGCDV
jgi:hypothetical protein